MLVIYISLVGLAETPGRPPYEFGGWESSIWLVRAAKNAFLQAMGPFAVMLSARAWACMMVLVPHFLQVQLLDWHFFTVQW